MRCESQRGDSAAQGVSGGLAGLQLEGGAGARSVAQSAPAAEQEGEEEGEAAPADPPAPSPLPQETAPAPRPDPKQPLSWADRAKGAGRPKVAHPTDPCINATLLPAAVRARFQNHLLSREPVLPDL